MLNYECVKIGRRMIRDWSATIPVMEKTVAMVAEVAIKISRREVELWSQALWDRGLCDTMKLEMLMWSLTGIAAIFSGMNSFVGLDLGPNCL